MVQRHGIPGLCQADRLPAQEVSPSAGSCSYCLAWYHSFTHAGHISESRRSGSILALGLLSQPGASAGRTFPAGGSPVAYYHVEAFNRLAPFLEKWDGDTSELQLLLPLHPAEHCLGADSSAK